VATGNNHDQPALWSPSSPGIRIKVAVAAGVIALTVPILWASAPALASAGPQAGSIVSVTWDVTGSGEFSSEQLKHPGPSARVSKTVTFTVPGTYVVALRAVEQRSPADASSPFTQVQNLDRVRVVVDAGRRS